MPKVPRRQWERIANDIRTQEENRARMLRQQILIVLAFTGLVWFASDFASADVAEYQYEAGKNVTWAFTGTTDGTVDRFDFFLAEIKDLNNDGDLADAGEVTLHIQELNVVNCANVVQNFSCGISPGNEFMHVVWHNNSTLQVQDRNYSVFFRLETALGTVIGTKAFGIRFVDTLPILRTISSDVAAHSAASVLNVANLTGHNDTMVSQHTNHNTNSTTHNDTMTTQHAAQDITHPTPGGCDAACVGNISQNVTQNFTRFSTDCHGTGSNLCINGHAPNVLDQMALRHVLVIGVYLALVYAAFQGGYGLSFGSGILSLFVMMFLFEPVNHGFLGSAAITILAGVLFILPLGIGFWNGSTEYRQRNVQEDSMH